MSNGRRFSVNTQVNGKPATWSEEVQAKWDAAMADEKAPEGEVTSSNYFTPRPWRNEYDRGSVEGGFTYTINHRHVWQVITDRQSAVERRDEGSC